jgi:S-DNA-T family DNA segregation ATPase FtsK/SpoIIIE
VSARVATVPGRNVIGIELPNARRETVFLRELLSTRHYEDTRSTCRWRWARTSAAIR